MKATITHEHRQEDVDAMLHLFVAHGLTPAEIVTWAAVCVKLLELLPAGASVTVEIPEEKS